MEVVLTTSVDNGRASSYGFTTALYLLCSYYKNDNLIGYVQQLLKQKGIRINMTDDTGKTALHHVCDVYQHENLIDLVRLLIQHGADVNARDVGFRETPLFHLCWNYKKENLMEIVQLLVENGADINAENEAKASPRLKLHNEGFHT